MRKGENIAKYIFLVCAVVAILAVLSITGYMIYKGTPALGSVGVTELLFGTEWAPTAKEPSYGIFYIILTSIVGTAAALLIGVPIGILTAVFVGWVWRKEDMRAELTAEGGVDKATYPFIRFLLRYVCPVLVSVVFIFGIVDFIKTL